MKILLFLLLFSLPAYGHEVSGYPHIVDGDTLWFGKKSIRLLCIDAPEMDTLEGAEAKDRLLEMIGGKEVKCQGNYYDKYDRLLAWCYVDKPSLNYKMLSYAKCKCKWFCGEKHE